MGSILHFLCEFIFAPLLVLVAFAALGNPMKWPKKKRWKGLAVVFLLTVVVGLTWNATKEKQASADTKSESGSDSTAANASSAPATTDAETKGNNSPVTQKIQNSAIGNQHVTRTTGDATTSGPESPAVTGSNVNITYGSSAPNSQKK